MSFCISRSEYLKNPGLYDIVDGPSESCPGCWLTLNSLSSYTYLGTTIVLSQYFADSPIYAYTGTTGESMQVPVGFNHAVYIDSSGNVTEENVMPGQTLTFKSSIIIGTAPTEVWMCTDNSQCIKVLGILAGGGFSSQRACLENCCASWCTGGVVACCNFGERFECKPTCNGVCCESEENVCLDNVCSPCPRERQINDDNNPFGLYLGCCPEGKVRCLAEIIEGDVLQDVCCPEEKCCGVDEPYSMCCKDTETCISDECCPQERICETTFDGTVCCPEGEVCVGGRCCPQGKEVCRNSCYDPCANGEIRNTSTCECDCPNRTRLSACYDNNKIPSKPYCPDGWDLEDNSEYINTDGTKGAPSNCTCKTCSCPEYTCT